MFALAAMASTNRATRSRIRRRRPDPSDGVKESPGGGTVSQGVDEVAAEVYAREMKRKHALVDLELQTTLGKCGCVGEDPGREEEGLPRRASSTLSLIWQKK